MTNLKTIKDMIDLQMYDKNWIDEFRLRQEAIKWFKEKNPIVSEDWIEFFNITKDDLAGKSLVESK